MKKSLLVLTVISATYTTIGAAQDQNFYAGLGMGRSSADVTGISRQDVLGIGFNSLSSFQNGTTKTDIAWKVYGGYRFNPYVAAELFYTDLGKFSREASGTGVTASSSTLSFNLNSDLKITGFGAAALLGAPITDQWNLFAKPGLLFWDAQRTSTATTTSSSQSGSIDKNGSSLSFGVGTEYMLTARLSTRFEWERYFSVGDKNTTDKSNVNVFALSVQFSP